ncbi:hypothetical protein Tco_1113445 [Tanacetum coccineum]|uniref:Uncharacterized protein n=1 Tax=Tanacetum coccineum TaxID=301880 RepID=A0ABQ5IUJ7_9ASTR
MVKLTTFAVMCKAYGGEPNVDLLRAFLNLGPAGNWLILSNGEIDFRSFMMEGIDGEFNFLPKGGLNDEGGSPSTKSVNNEAPRWILPPKLLERENKLLSLLRKDLVEKPKGYHLRQFPSAKELKDSADCHWVVAHVTPPSWKQRLKEISLEKLYDIQDKAYMRKAVLDNIKVEKDKAYAKLERKCNEALQGLEKNPLVLDMHSEIETLQGQVDRLHEVNSLRQDRADVVSKVVPYVATELVRSDEMGLLVARLIKAAMFRGRCMTFEEVAALNKPFVLEKMPCYRSSSKKGFDQAGDDLAIASYPFVTKAVADPYATVEQLILKKPKSLCTKPALSHSKPSSSKAPIS